MMKFFFIFLFFFLFSNAEIESNLSLKTPKEINNYAMFLYSSKPPYVDQDKAVKLLNTLIKDYNLTDSQKSIVLFNLGVIYYFGYATKDNKIIIKRKDAKILLRKSYQLGYKPAGVFLKKYYNEDINVTKK